MNIARRLTVSALSLALAACGGTEGTSQPTAANPNQGGTPPTAPTSAQTPAPSAEGTPTPTEAPASALFSATLSAAPEEGATIDSPTRIEVRGNGLENVELLPPDTYQPRLATFHINQDKTLAWLDFDGNGLPNGNLFARIVAFSTPPGENGQQIEVMAPRTWLLRRYPVPALSGAIPPASYMPEVHLVFPDFPYVDPQPLNEMMSLDDAAFERLMNDEPERVRQILHTYLPVHVVLMPPVPNGFYGPWYACTGTPQHASCREAMAYMIGIMNGKAP